MNWNAADNATTHGDRDFLQILALDRKRLQTLAKLRMSTDIWTAVVCWEIELKPIRASDWRRDSPLRSMNDLSRVLAQIGN
jgi:hypothetical protein